MTFILKVLTFNSAECVDHEGIKYKDGEHFTYGTSDNTYTCECNNGAAVCKQKESKFFFSFKQYLFFTFAPGARAHRGSLCKLYVQ